MYENADLSMFCAGTGKNEWYRAGNGGALETNTWHLNKYYLEDGRRASGLCEIGGVLYYFDTGNGSMCRDRIATENGVEYFVDDRGICTPVSRYAGWIGTSAHWYYVENDACLRSTVIKQNNRFYGFDAEGRMYDGRSLYPGGFPNGSFI